MWSGWSRMGFALAKPIDGSGGEMVDEEGPPS
jgi:hypothetical protein